jgi:hypothetical protein
VIESHTYYSDFWGQRVLVFRYWSKPYQECIGDRKAIRFLCNYGEQERENFVPEYQWFLQNRTQNFFEFNPFQLSIEETLLLKDILFTEEESMSYLEFGIPPKAVVEVLRGRSLS